MGPYPRSCVLLAYNPFFASFAFMRIYIDEAGPFIPPHQPRSSFSLVLSLIVPTAVEKDLFYDFLRLRDTWPNQDVEIKDSSLDESQVSQVISLLLRYETLIQFIGLDLHYYAVPGNLDSLRVFRDRSIGQWWHTLRRRSQKHPISWTRTLALADRWFPQPRVLHPYPAIRFAANHPR